MWKTYAVLASLAMSAIVACGCAGSGASQPGTATTTAPTAMTSTARQPIEGSHADRTYMAPNALVSRYRSVYVAPPVMDTTADRNEKVNDLLAQMEITIRVSTESALRRTGRFELVTTDEQAAKAKGKYLVCRNDVLVHPGSAAARLLISFGAGRSKLIIVTSLEDGVTRDMLLKYTGWGGWALAGSAVTKMQLDAGAIANHFGDLVKQAPN